MKRVWRTITRLLVLVLVALAYRGRGGRGVEGERGRLELVLLQLSDVPVRYKK